MTLASIDYSPLIGLGLAVISVAAFIVFVVKRVPVYTPEDDRKNPTLRGQP